mmetsp:Transcript_1859/g.2436  ORF Transcript_1859/g.2436 Transcript_1859/m.2436 type:complete len:81 (+) Transcript_1859:3-245(+)
MIWEYDIQFDIVIDLFVLCSNVIAFHVCTGVNMFSAGAVVCVSSVILRVAAFAFYLFYVWVPEKSLSEMLSLWVAIYGSE